MATPTLYPQAQQPRGITPETMQHFYAGVITRALEANRLRPIVAPAYDGPQLTESLCWKPLVRNQGRKAAWNISAALDLSL